jgi:hypothetical protein
MSPPPILATRLNGSNSLHAKRTAATMLMSTNFTNDFTFAITFNFLIVNTFVVLKFLMQSYDALAQETTKSQFFVTVICGGYMLFVTNKLPFAITVAATRKHKETEAADFRFSILIFGELASIPRCLTP